MATDRARLLLPLVLAYLPLPAVTTVLTFVWKVGASGSSRDPRDVFLKGTGLAPPAFLPVALAAGAAAARRADAVGTAGLAVCALVGAGFLGGSTVNLPNDLAAARAAGTPRWLTPVLAAVHVVVAVALLSIAIPALVTRLRG